MSPIALGTFTPPVGGKAGSFDPRNHADKPLIVVVREFRKDFTTRRFPNPKDVIIVDIVDILADAVHISVIWGSGAIVDRLKDQVPQNGEAPQRLPVKISHVTSGAGNPYCTVDPLEGKALELAAAWDQRYPTRIDDERAAREDETRNAVARYEAGDQTGAAPAPAFQGLGNGQQPAPQQQAPAAQPQQQVVHSTTAPQQQAPAAQPQQQQAPAASAPGGMSDADIERAIAALG
jgi:hypothetical protein